MFKRLVLGFMVATLTLGLFPVLPVSAAQPQNNPISTTCETLSVNLTGYAATVPSDPGQPYIAPTYKTITIPGIAQVTHDEYKYQATKNNKPTQYTDWVLSVPAAYGQGYSAWVQIDHRVVIDLAATPAHDIVVVDNPGQPYVAPTPEKTNSIVVDIDSANVENTTFSTTYNNSFNYSNKYVSHIYHVVVTAWNGSNNIDTTAASVPCDNLDHKIDICHANNGVKNYVEQNVDFDSILKNNGHAEHQDGRDIIPPFDYVKDGVPGHFNGLNWGPDGQDIYNAHCVVTPDKPNDIVDIKTMSSVDCEEGTVTTITTTTTTGWVLVDNQWVEDEPSVVDSSETRPATEQELVDCVVTPDKPEDKMTIDVKESVVDCETELVTITTTTTTTGWVLVDNQWVEDEPSVSEVITTRLASEQELLNCIVLPDKPEDKVSTSINESVSCTTKLVTTTTTTTTTSFVLVDNEWAPSEPNVTTDTTTREATDEELSECTIDTPETPSNDDGEVLGASTIATLPKTSGNNTLGSTMIITLIAIITALFSIVVRNIVIRRV